KQRRGGRGVQRCQQALVRWLVAEHRDPGDRGVLRLGGSALGKRLVDDPLPAALDPADEAAFDRRPAQRVVVGAHRWVEAAKHVGRRGVSAERGGGPAYVEVIGVEPRDQTRANVDAVAREHPQATRERWPSQAVEVASQPRDQAVSLAELQATDEPTMTPRFGPI